MFGTLLCLRCLISIKYLGCWWSLVWTDKSHLCSSANRSNVIPSILYPIMTAKPAVVLVRTTYHLCLAWFCSDKSSVIKCSHCKVLECAYSHLNWSTTPMDLQYATYQLLILTPSAPWYNSILMVCLYSCSNLCFSSMGSFWEFGSVKSSYRKLKRNDLFGMHLGCVLQYRTYRSF